MKRLLILSLLAVMACGPDIEADIRRAREEEARKTPGETWLEPGTRSGRQVTWRFHIKTGTDPLVRFFIHGWVNDQNGRPVETNVGRGSFLCDFGTIGSFTSRTKEIIARAEPGATSVKIEVRISSRGDKRFEDVVFLR